MFSSFWFHLAVLISLLLVRTILASRLQLRSPRLRAQFLSARETCDSLSLTLFLVFFFIQPFVAQAYYIPTASMENSLPVGTRILASPLAPRVTPIEAGEVLVFSPPQTALDLSNQQEGEVWIKRCVATPGQRVEIRKNVLWRDGKPISEPYAIWKSPGLLPIQYDLKIVGGAVYSREYDALGKPALWTQAQVAVTDQNAISRARSGVVPPDRFLMLGDHRNDSLDGHVWGFLPRSAIVGRAFASFWPPKQIGTITQ